MDLKKLFEDVADCQFIRNGIAINKEQIEFEVSGVASHTSRVKNGFLFICKTAGKYVQEAISNGALAILVQHFLPDFSNLMQIIYHSPHALEAEIASKFYGSPDNHLKMIAVTGTNGKTTTSLMIKDLLDALHMPSGLIGTVKYDTGAVEFVADRTTPDCAYLHFLLSEMVYQQQNCATLEVTSHALDQNRVDNVAFDIAVFTQLTSEHLDYHGTMEKYAKAKNRLFRELGQISCSKSAKDCVAIVNIDCLWHDKVIAGCQATNFTYGLTDKADLYAKNYSFYDNKTNLEIVYRGEIVKACLPFVGLFNIYNCLAAIATLLALKFSLTEIAQKIKNLAQIEGRLQRVENSLGLKIYIDFAHSEDALKNVLKSLRQTKPLKIYTVFGCGGDRDRFKRPKMAQVAEKYADFSIVTSDNPRSENPLDICLEVASGFKNAEKYLVEVDRQKAIKIALQKAGAEDVVLIAGRGHEDFQQFDNHKLAFKDADMVVEMANILAESSS